MLFRSHLEFYISRLSEEAKICVSEFSIINNVLDFDLKISELDYFYYDYAIELENFKKEIECLLRNMDFIKRNRFIKYRIKEILMYEQKYYYIQMDTFFESLFDEFDNVKVFKFIEIFAKVLYSGYYAKMNCYTNFYMQQGEGYLSRKALGELYDLTPERIRQICVCTLALVYKYGGRLINPYYKFFIPSELKSINSHIVIYNDFVERTNTLEDVNFNATFYSHFFALYFEHLYTTFLIHNLTSKKKLFNGKIFIKTSIYNKYNFKKLVQELYKLQKRKIYEKREIKFNDIISEFWLPDAKININEILDVCKGDRARGGPGPQRFRQCFRYPVRSQRGLHPADCPDP